MIDWLKKRFEIWRISVARKILIGRNVQRSAYVSRRDNNEMWAMAERLEAIEKRMLKNYE
ncbi:hypothetical protein OCF84_21485 (plasmid) [Shewanella xiamenensis]|uniref:Transposase n=1 Tax=Shewanella xiamenensis TaxID=332186 RepID=A0ABT6UDK2_9GAMM|nr:hypothetical protein [Shewanella xiamenensis]MDI5832550.1 hypothetical protein [Shewanella xiamenensis]WHF57832.1 hypothetical protein OCF84_21485 [Shewanella xiamenensis]